MYYNYGYDYGGYDGVLSAVLGAFAAVWFIALAIGILTIIATWKVYQKAREPGWAALIPFYSTYVLFKITWGNGWYFLMLIGASILASIFSGLGGFGVVLSSLLGIFSFVIFILTSIKLAKAFGKDGGFAVGLILLNPIFMCILAFSKDIFYVGVPGKTAPGGYNYGPQGYQQPGYGQQGYQQPGYQNPYAQGYQQPPYQAPNPQQPPYQVPDPQQGAYQQPSPQNPDYFYQQNATPAGPKYCSGCGTPIENGGKFCPKCGKPL